MKASDRQELSKTLAPILAKEFGPAPPESDRPVLETLIYSILLEDLPAATAEDAYARLTGGFADLNDIRVSTISEIVAVLKGLPRPELRAHRVRTVLQTVFEDRYEFTLEPIRKKTLDAAAKALEKIRDLSAFNRQYTLQHALKGHAVPVDGTTGRAAVWLGLAEGDPSTDQIDEAAIAESLKHAIRKADAAEFNHLLRAFATDDRFAPHFGKKWGIPEGGYDFHDAPARLKAALKDPKSAIPPARDRSKTKPDPADEFPAGPSAGQEPSPEEPPAESPDGGTSADGKADDKKPTGQQKSPGAKTAGAKKAKSSGGKGAAEKVSAKTKSPPKSKSPAKPAGKASKSAAKGAAKASTKTKS